MENYKVVLLLLGLAWISSGQRSGVPAINAGVQYNSTETNRTQSTGPGIQIRSFNNATETNRTNTVPGIQLRAFTCATLFQHSKYGGSRKNMFETEYLKLSGIWNDFASSLKVRRGCRLTAYEHSHSSGESKIFTKDTNWVGSHWNDKMSAVSCQCGTHCATLFQHSNYGGSSLELTSSSRTRNIPSDWNDQVSAMKIDNGCSLTLYRDYYGRGPTKTYTSNTPWMFSENDQLSSYKCSC
eukprot:TRINITY_DN11877_c0_g1_i1.p1 TRINITY_DN11877_c0_g1~~TRINITY_DN11877_c0_g1_i1.p1  ORF type:complete len:257 (+),score=34.42 TRINITY_DN11877_c0_g1_i1:52-771(+)